MIDTLKYSKDLEAAGNSRAQAEAHVSVFAQIVEADLATKQDLKDLENRLVSKLTAIVVTTVSLGVAILALFVSMRG